MKSVLIPILLVATSLAQTATPAPTVAQLLGTWKLVSIEDTMNDGKVQPPLNTVRTRTASSCISPTDICAPPS